MTQASNRTSDDTTRTTITLSKDLLRRLKIEAAERGTSMNEVVCRALEAHMRELEAPAVGQRKLRSLGAVDTGPSDTARRSAYELPPPPAWRS